VPTDDSTDALHAADGGVPDGILKDTDTVSTTVVGGRDDTDGLCDDVIDADALLDSVALPDDATDAVSNVEAVAEGVADADALIVKVVLADDATDGVTDDVRDTLDDDVASDDAVTLLDSLEDDCTLLVALEDTVAEGYTDVLTLELSVALGVTLNDDVALDDALGDDVALTDALDVTDALADGELE